MHAVLLFTTLLALAPELTACVRVSQQDSVTDLESELPLAAALPQVSSSQDAQASVQWGGGRSACNDVVLGGMRRLTFWSDTACKCAEGRYIYGDDEECQPYLESRNFPMTLTPGVCQCRSYSTQCNAGLFLSVTKQPNLAVSRVYVDKENQVFARFEHETGCNKTFRIKCKDNFASISSVMRCPDVKRRVSASDMPGKPGPFLRRWEACSNGEGKVRLLQPLIDSTWLAEFSNETVLDGCVEIVSPAQMHQLRNVRGSVEEQKATLRTVKTELGGCPGFVEPSDVGKRPLDFPGKEGSISNIMEEFRKRALILTGESSFWMRTFGQPYASVPERAGGAKLGFNRDRRKTLGYELFTELNCGEPLPLVNGPMIFQHAEVAAAAADPESPRNYTTYTVSQTEICFDRTLVNFQTTGQLAHTEVRQLLDEAVFGPLLLESLPPLPTFQGPSRADGNSAPTEKEVGRQVLTLVMAAMWTRGALTQVVDQIMPYLSAGKKCLFGEGQGLGSIGYFDKGRIAKAKRAMLEFAKGSHRYLTITNLLNGEKYPEAKKLHSQTTGVSASDKFVANIVDSVLFNGILSTTNMAHACVKRQWDDPNHVSLYRANKADYLHEVMRMDSAVAGFTTSTKEDTTMNVQQIHERLPVGSPMQMVIAGANYDAKVFNNAYEFDPARLDMGEMLSWNGRLSDVRNRDYERTPRFCPGYNLSMRVAERVCDYFTNQL